ncbi:hypothetical protein [Anaerosphaera multitolerans]|uniref:Uncharacterized protein n=1 Tax=Anaerosphaera multitolerans TaxID=2487351 RepID=A0A437S743_9FIRM|nr:hypothetical protein [Anaerosphaera multitolerans]RVU54855.1 hypothetical protein EF514_04515 [Anaerosphaera multitolerans]
MSSVNIINSLGIENSIKRSIIKRFDTVKRKINNEFIDKINENLPSKKLEAAKFYFHALLEEEFKSSNTPKILNYKTRVMKNCGNYDIIFVYLDNLTINIGHKTENGLLNISSYKKMHSQKNLQLEGQLFMPEIYPDIQTEGKYYGNIIYELEIVENAVIISNINLTIPDYTYSRSLDSENLNKYLEIDSVNNDNINNDNAVNLKDEVKKKISASKLLKIKSDISG